MAAVRSVQLTPREMAVLAHVVDAYVHTAEPVGSQAVAQRLRSTETVLAPATVRAIMADLETAGLLTHPYTSSGRVPTAHGLRYYLDCLVEYEPIDPQQRAQMALVGADATLPQMVQRVSRTLARLSSYCGVVVVPSRQELVFRQLEFVKLSARRVLGIFVTRDGETINRVIEVAEEISYQQLERINNACNAAFVGLTLADARAKAERVCAELTHDVQALTRQAMQLASAVLADTPAPALAVEGANQLLEYPEFAAAERLKPLLAALDEQQQIAQLLRLAEAEPSVRVFVGAESGFDALHACGVVVSPYHRHGQVVGTLGVIGPARMAYGRVVPIVMCAAEQIGQWLEEES